MKIFLTEEEVLKLAGPWLDVFAATPDKIGEYAERMDMVYDWYMDMWEDIGEVSLRVAERPSRIKEHALFKRLEAAVNMIAAFKGWRPPYDTKPDDAEMFLGVASEYQKSIELYPVTPVVETW